MRLPTINSSLFGPMKELRPTDGSLENAFGYLGYADDEHHNLLPHICTIYVELLIIMTSNLPKSVIHCVPIFQVNNSYPRFIVQREVHEKVFRQDFWSQSTRSSL